MDDQTDKKSKRKVAKKVFFIIAFGWIPLCILYIAGMILWSHVHGPHERHFMKQIETHYRGTDTPLPIEMLTDFEWDRLCVLIEYSITPDTTRAELSEKTGADWESYAGRLPNMRGHRVIPQAYVRFGLVFIEDKKVAHFLKYKGTALKIDSRKFFVISDDHQELCLMRENAYLHHDERLSGENSEYLVIKGKG